MSPRARLLFFVTCLIAAAVCVRLGFWQRARLASRRAANSAILEARRLPAVSLGAASWRVVDQQRVSARGTYDHDHEMLIRHQVIGGVPGVVVVTPLLHGSMDSAVLVLRGFLPSGDAVSAPALDSLREPGEQQVEGRAMRLRTWPDGGAPLERGGRMTWRTLDAQAIRSALPYPVSDLAIRQDTAAALGAFPRRLAAERLDDGPHWSYMMQWFGFATIATFMGSWVLLRRRAPEWTEPTAGSPTGGAQPPSPRP